MIAESERQGALTDFKRKTKELIAQQRAFTDRLAGDEMVEKVARAICKAEGYEPVKTIGFKAYWQDSINEAKAALAVVREMVGK